MLSILDLNRTLTSLLGSLVIWGAVAGVCLWFLDYRSLFRGGYELVTFRHVQLGLAAFSGWRALEALRELLVPPELDSPVRRWTRWIPLTWLSLPMCLASLLAMLYFPEALAEAGRSRPTRFTECLYLLVSACFLRAFFPFPFMRMGRISIGIC